MMVILIKLTRVISLTLPYVEFEKKKKKKKKKKVWKEFSEKLAGR